MKITLAPDSFKGSLSALDVAEIMQKAIKDLYEHDVVTLKPMADGGEGTLACMMSGMDGEEISLACTGPLGTSIQTHYGKIDGEVAIIESALIAGIELVPLEERNPDYTTSYGIGEAILHALDHGCKSMIIGIGGSATNDGGLGMLQALGVRMLDEDGEHVGVFGKNLLHVKAIDYRNIDQRLKNVSIQIATDVDNPLCGNRGASAVYGPQKGATKKQVILYDQMLKRFANKIERHLNVAYQRHPGAGAAGGLGFAFLTIGAKVVQGAQIIAQAIDLEGAIQQSDMVITGEGKSDEQTLYGKAPGFVASLAEKYNKPIILLSGSVAGDRSKLLEVFTGSFSIINEPLSLQESMEQVETLIYEQTQQVIHFSHKLKGE